MPLGLLKTVAELSSLGGLDPADALALAIGDLPGIAGVVVDGSARVLRSRNTPAPAREATVTGRSAARWPR